MPKYCIIRNHRIQLYSVEGVPYANGFELIDFIPGKDLTPEEVENLIKEKGLKKIKDVPGDFEVWA